jgi:preprotein translocase subunit SecA
LLKQYGRTVDRINALEASIGRLSDAELRAKTDEVSQAIGRSDRRCARKPSGLTRKRKV